MSEFRTDVNFYKTVARAHCPHPPGNPPPPLLVFSSELRLPWRNLVLHLQPSVSEGAAVSFIVPCVLLSVVYFPQLPSLAAD